MWATGLVSVGGVARARLWLLWLRLWLALALVAAEQACAAGVSSSRRGPAHRATRQRPVADAVQRPVAPRGGQQESSFAHDHAVVAVAEHEARLGAPICCLRFRRSSARKASTSVWPRTAPIVLVLLSSRAGAAAAAGAPSA
jgi:hypothetical protein